MFGKQPSALILGYSSIPGASQRCFRGFLSKTVLPAFKQAEAQCPRDLGITRKRDCLGNAWEGQIIDIRLGTRFI